MNIHTETQKGISHVMIAVIVGVFAVAVVGNFYMLKDDSSEGMNEERDESAMDGDISSPEETTAPTGSSQGTTKPKTTTQTKSTTQSPTPTVTPVAPTGARALALQVLELNKQRRFIELYNTVCAEDRLVSAPDYAQYQIDAWGNTRVTSYEIKDLKESALSTQVLYGEVYSTGASKGGEFLFLKRGAGWCLHSDDPQRAADILSYKNIEVTIRNFVLPWSDGAVKPQNDGVRISVSVKNNGDKEFFCHETYDLESTLCRGSYFTLKGGDGVTRTPLSGAVSPFRLGAGETFEGELVYEIPHNSKGYRFVFLDPGYKREIINIGAGF